MLDWRNEANVRNSIILSGSRIWGLWNTAQELCYSLRYGQSSILPALNFQPAVTREPDALCGNKRYRRELLMMGIMVPETC